MFFEFTTMDIDDGFILIGCDGPSSVDVAAVRPRLAHVEVHHGKSGHGLSVDSDVPQGPTRLPNHAQFDAGDTFTMILSLAEAVLGPSLTEGEPDCRMRVSGPIREFTDGWRQQSRSHPIGLGVGIRSGGLDACGEAMGFGAVRA